MRTLLTSFAAFTLAGIALAATPAFAQAHWDVTNTMHVGGEGGWDYLTVDPAGHRLFVPRSTHTLVLDENTGKTLGDIPGTTHNHGVAVVPAVNRGFITDGAGGLVIFDLKTYAVLGKLASAPDSDGIIYDASVNKVLFVSGDEGVLMTVSPDVDPVHGKIDAPIALGGKPEFLAADGAGKVFINLQDKSNVAVVDLKARKVLAHWPVAPGGSPVGMAIDTAHHKLFIGCRRPQMLVEMSTDDGKVLGAVPIGAGVDATAYADGQAFASCGDGTLTIAGDHDGKFAVESTVNTARGARTMGIDPEAHKIFLPAKSGAFDVIEVDRK